jgi:hypothetical protein
MHQLRNSFRNMVDHHSLDDSDTKKKYSGKVAELYKEELARRVKDDAVRCEIDDFFNLSAID